jgi:hypothetical protein
VKLQLHDDHFQLTAAYSRISSLQAKVLSLCRHFYRASHHFGLYMTPVGAGAATFD